MSGMFWFLLGVNVGLLVLGFLWFMDCRQIKRRQILKPLTSHLVGVCDLVIQTPLAVDV